MMVELDSIADRVERLPALPSTSVRIMEVAMDPKATINDILDVVKYDQNLTGQILRLCNSAYYGLVRQISSLKEALAYLGSTPLLQLIMGVHFNSILQSAQPGYGLLAGMLWRHSAATGLASEKIGRLFDHEKPEVLFTAGLLHDIGKVILGNFLSDRYQEVMDRLNQESLRFHEAEKAVLGFTHAEVGELISRRWRLPEPIVMTTRYHHEPRSEGEADAETRTVVQVVHLADSLAMTLGMGVGNDGLLYSIDPEIAREYKVDHKTLERVGMDVVSEVQKLEVIYVGSRGQQ